MKKKSYPLPVNASGRSEVREDKVIQVVRSHDGVVQMEESGVSPPEARIVMENRPGAATATLTLTQFKRSHLASVGRMSEPARQNVNRAGVDRRSG